MIRTKRPLGTYHSLMNCCGQFFMEHLRLLNDPQSLAPFCSSRRFFFFVLSLVLLTIPNHPMRLDNPKTSFSQNERAGACLEKVFRDLHLACSLNCEAQISTFRTHLWLCCTTFLFLLLQIDVINIHPNTCLKKQHKHLLSWLLASRFVPSTLRAMCTSTHVIVSCASHSTTRARRHSHHLIKVTSRAMGLSLITFFGVK